MNQINKSSGYSIASFILGIIGIATIWPIYLSGVPFFIFPFSHTPIGLLAIIFGAIGFFKKQPKWYLGLTGGILGILTGVIGLIGFLIRINILKI
jgi:hypothetical protein